MIFSICRRVSLRRGCPSPWSGKYPCVVRRNASTTSSTVMRSASPNGIRDAGKNAAAVESLLKQYGFSDAHISEVARRCSPIFTLTAKNLSPKLEFLSSVGLSSSDLPVVVLKIPYILSSSLHDQLIPSYSYLKDVPLDGEQLARTLKLYPGILLTEVNTVLAPNLELLTGNGVPHSSVAVLLIRYAGTICRNHDTFKSSFNQAVAMGLQPSTYNFILGLHIICGISKQKWDYKVKLYKGFGLSDDEFLRAFLKHPNIMGISEKNIKRKMEFFTNELGWAPAALAHSPVVFLLSLEARVMPRCHVIEILVKRGFAPKASTVTLLKLGEEEFLNKYIKNYVEDLPDLLDIYKKSRSSKTKMDLFH